MAENWQPDVKIAETYVRHGEQEFQVYTFERDSSAAGYGPRRYQETHVYEWDREKRERGAWLNQVSGYGIEFHCIVVAEIARHGKYDPEEYEASSYEAAKRILDEAARKAVRS